MRGEGPLPKVGRAQGGEGDELEHAVRGPGPVGGAKHKVPAEQCLARVAERFPPLPERRRQLAIPRSRRYAAIR